MKNWNPFLLSLCLLASSFNPVAEGADFELGLGYAQSHDFWETVHDVQRRTGNLSEIQKVVNEHYGVPDILYSYLDASYSYPHSWFDSETFSHAWINTRAEALAGGQLSNPVFPEIQAYANTTGIASYGIRSRADALLRGYSFWSFRFLLGMGPERRLFAKGSEFIDAIPVRSGTLFLGGVELSFLKQSEFDHDFWVTSYGLLRPVYFHSTVPPARSFPDDDNSFMVWRWRLQNEWMKQVDSSLASRTRFGLISVLGQTPIPFTSIPITWDYQQKTPLFTTLSSGASIGGILRLISDKAMPNLAIYGGLFGGAIGGGIDLQLGAVLLNFSSYALENSFITSRERTRLWQAALGVSL